MGVTSSTPLRLSGGDMGVTIAGDISVTSKNPLRLPGGDMRVTSAPRKSLQEFFVWCNAEPIKVFSACSGIRVDGQLAAFLQCLNKSDRVSPSDLLTVCQALETVKANARFFVDGL